MPSPYDGRPNFLYRLYDAEDRLLYAGVAVDVDRRLASLRSEMKWWPTVARHTAEEYPTRHAALDAKEEAIYAELPLHVGRHVPGADVSQYTTETARRQRLTELHASSYELAAELRMLVQQMLAAGVSSTEVSSIIGGGLPSRYIPRDAALVPRAGELVARARVVRQEQRQNTGECRSLESAMTDDELS